MIEQTCRLARTQDLDAGVKKLPILIAHGNNDPQIKWNWADRSQRAIKELGFTNVEFLTYRLVKAPFRFSDGIK